MSGFRDLILNQEWIIEFDPMIVFYCLYFCVFYNNKVMLDYIKQLIFDKELSSLKPEQAPQTHEARKSVYRNIKNKVIHGLDRTPQKGMIDKILMKI